MRRLFTRNGGCVSHIGKPIRKIIWISSACRPKALLFAEARGVAGFGGIAMDETHAADALRNTDRRRG
jgi:hypothetical protein